MDLIDRQAVLEHLYQRLIESANNNIGVIEDAGITFEDIATERIKVWIDEVPSAQPERKKGKLLNANPIGECSVCGYLIDYRDGFNFCPNCGIEME